jgi:hypothetical protein
MILDGCTTRRAVMNREEWLSPAAEQMAPWFEDQGYALPRYRVAIGFSSTGKRGKRIGECWDGKASADGTFEVLIRPDQSDPIAVAAILAHELVHAAVSLKCGHKGAFRKIATRIGLEGKMTATRPGETFKRNVAAILATIGALPHAALGFGASSAPPKQKARLLKAECDDCGYTVRVTRKWVDEAGAPHCPKHGAMQVDGIEAEDGDADELAEAA